jgi:tetratricopeptide (TPR) repeat protein
MAKQSPGAVRLLALNGAIPRDTAAGLAVDRAWDLRYTDHQEMLTWANLAVELAESSEARSLAHAHLGNAFRVASRFTEARQQLDLAGELHDHPDPLILEFRASLLEHLGGFDQALTCLRTAGRLRATEGDIDGQAKILTKKGIILTEAGHHPEAVQAYLDALDLVDCDPDVGRAAIHGLAHTLARSGQPYRALAVLRQGRPLLDQADPLFQLRVTWLLGRIAMVCDADTCALTSLEAAHLGFAERQLPYETCLTALDLAVHHARRSRAMAAHQILDPVPELLAQLGVTSRAEIAATLRHLLEGEITQALLHLDRLITSVENRPRT